MDKITELVRSFIDLHCHIGPEILPRRYTARGILEAESGRIEGLALKNHVFPTTPFIAEAKEQLPDRKLRLIGSVTLNNFVGGFNPDAVYAAAKLSSERIIVWFPTIHAANHIQRRPGAEIPAEWGPKGFLSRSNEAVKPLSILDSAERILPEVLEVLIAIRDNRCILATGHIAWQESKILVKEALRLGVGRFIITHPIYRDTAMPIEVQRELTQLPAVYAEQCYAMHSIDRVPLAAIAQQIGALPVEKVILSSDMGQVTSPSASEGLAMFSRGLCELGIEEPRLAIMGAENPRKILD
ncbi:MAG: hypothetical protein K1X83_02310 [Oligoflexia bacterium]|nr:hypothetical protein [Oligoflexia bacterium]